MARLVVMYGQPKDAGAFDKHYFERQIPLAKKIPGLRKYEISRGAIATPGGAARYLLIAILFFDDLKAIQSAFASPEGQAAAADAAAIATGGVEMFFFEHDEV